MKKRTALVLAGCLFYSCAYADEGDQYLIAKLGAMQIQLNDADPLFSGGVYYGYGITGDITAEAELNIGITGGDYGAGTDTGKYRIWTLAGYGVYRYPLLKTAYLKGKLGLLYESVKNEGRVTTNTATAFGLAGGLGGGYVLGNGLTLEAESTLIDEDIIFWSLGVHYPF